MGELGKPRRIRRASALAAVFALSSTLAAQALDAGGLLAPILAPGTSGPAGSVAALQNAASIAALFLTTECVIADKPEQDSAPAMPGGGMDDF